MHSNFDREARRKWIEEQGRIINQKSSSITMENEEEEKVSYLCDPGKGYESEGKLFYHSHDESFPLMY